MNLLEQIKLKINEIKDKSIKNFKKTSKELKNNGNKAKENIKEKGIEYIEAIDAKEWKLVEWFKGLSYEGKMKVVLSVSASFLAIASFGIRTKAYEVYMHDEMIGIFRSEEEVNLAFEEVKEELCSAHGMEIVLTDDIDLQRVHVLDNKLTEKTKLKDAVKDKVSFSVEGYQLSVNGKLVGTLGSEDQVKKVLQSVENDYKKELDRNIKVDKVEILEDVKIEKKEVPMFSIKDSEELHQNIMNGGEDVTIHTVEPGDSLWTIAERYDTTIDDLIDANPDKDPDKIQINDEVKLIKTKPLLTVSITGQMEYEEEIEYEEEVNYNKEMYANKKEVEVEGKKGKSKVVAKVITHNGKIIEKKILEENILEEPVNRLVVQGTKEVPSTIGTGSFSMPTRGRLSSPYGRRNGRMHRGIDIAARTGTPINSADGGTVTFAGYQGAYGYLVEIDHKNGYKTKYAHCSKIHVKVGDKVHKNQHIADIGNTGRSTGPHLHLEVLKNGVHQNPSKYVK